ncbi:hypothetical protein WH96_20550 [Kiloniella spongiae]|uniref:Uncharacterized protein n=1 Tax=Kiloniella spongiae TaxID=1489064 RepID=A0A0H2ME50_9PROT|nr:hypothetical protein [Kiloniella spongiae]KLN58897.1 hypothetical protein WH96_20550 [Kiloniella spongiae]
MNSPQSQFIKLKIPSKKNISILYPERIILEIEEIGNVWIGTLCYSRAYPKGNKYNIDLHSLVTTRLLSVKKIILFANDLFLNDPRRPITKVGIIRDFMRFIRWCDQNEMFDALNNKCKAVESYKKFVIYLHEQINTYKLKTGTAVTIQASVREILCSLFNTTDIHQGIKEVYKKNDSKSTLPPCEVRQAKTLGICSAIFNGFTDLLINKKLFPYALKVPRRIGLNNNKLWIFPSYKSFSIESNTHDTMSPCARGHALNWKEGKIRSIDEMIELYGCSKEAAQKKIYRTTKNLEIHNNDFKSYFRLEKARIAQTAFVILFIANTEMNRSQVFNLRWDDNYKIEKNKIGFRQIKYRAQNREVFFEIQASFLRQFLKYLKLRAYLNNKIPSNYLFRYPKKSKKQAIINVIPNISSLKRITEKIDKSLEFVNPIEWRAAKSDWYLNNTDPTTTSIALQNTEAVVLKHYAAGSHSKHVEEVGNFLTALSHIPTRIFSKKSPASTVILETALGGCSNFNNPTSTISTLKTPPDCNQPEGCLFCNKFLIHADVKDVQKLLSCLFCLEKTASFSANINQFESIYIPIKYRINQILDEISQISNRHRKMVKDTKSAVNEYEDLSPYWERKIMMFIEVGAISP